MKLRNIPIEIDSILVVVVIYRTPVESTPAWNSLLLNRYNKEKSLDVLIYDNSPSPQNMPEQSSLNILYMHDHRNPGVSTAYNKAARLAKGLNKDWLLLLDQDTEWNQSALSMYLETAVSHKDVKVFAPSVSDEMGLLSPFRFQWGSGRRLPDWKKELIDLSYYSVVNSGLLISVRVFCEAGGYDESIPLDFSDIDFCHRLARAGINAQHIPCVLKTRHSSSVPQVAESAIQRFWLYCKGAAMFARRTRDLIIPIRQHLRSVHLSLRYRNFQFIFISLKLRRL
ncbi:MAG: glycosyltransferase [Bacteroidetes bacterium]|nr:glycosyltransferase [Bacteroidota bacterium]